MLAVTSFVARFPDFAEVQIGVIQLMVDEANAEIPVDWSDHDLAAGYLAAHLLSIQGFGKAATAAGMHAASSGPKMMKVGDVAVSYGNHTDVSPNSTASRFASTIYGQRYLEIVKRNTPAIDVVF